MAELFRISKKRPQPKEQHVSPQKGGLQPSRKFNKQEQAQAEAFVPKIPGIPGLPPPYGLSKQRQEDGVNFHQTRELGTNLTQSFDDSIDAEVMKKPRKRQQIPLEEANQGAFNVIGFATFEGFNLNKSLQTTSSKPPAKAMNTTSVDFMKKNQPAHLKPHVSQTVSKRNKNGDMVKDNMYYGATSQTQTDLQTTTMGTTQVMARRKNRSFSNRKGIDSHKLSDVFKNRRDESPNSNISGTTPSRCQARASNYAGQCEACSRRSMQGHDHSVTSSMERRFSKWHNNFTLDGKCRRHKKLGCDICSRGSSFSKSNSRDSSLSKGQVFKAKTPLTRKMLLEKQKTKTPVRSKVNLPSVNKTPSNKPPKMLPQTVKQLSRKTVDLKKESNMPSVRNNDSNRSLPRQLGSMPGEWRDVKQQPNSKSVIPTTLKPQTVPKNAIRFNKSGNPVDVEQPVVVQKQQSVKSEFPITDRKNTVIDDDQTSQGKARLGRFHQTYASGFGSKEDWRFTRMRSTSRESARDKLVSSHSQNRASRQKLLDIEVKKMAEQWEGNPESDDFWKKFETNKREEMHTKYKKYFGGQKIDRKNFEMLFRQSDLFKTLTDAEKLAWLQEFGGKSYDLDQLKDMVNDDDSFFDGNDIPEDIGTDLPPDALRLARLNFPSVATDHDIEDVSVVPSKNNPNREIDFRDRNKRDIDADRNIDDKTLTAAQRQKKARQNYAIQEQPIADHLQNNTDDDEPAKPHVFTSQVEDNSSKRKRKRRRSGDAEPIEVEDQDSDKDGTHQHLNTDQSDVTEESYDDESDQDKKTVARVTNYDDYMERKTQQEIDRQSRQQSQQSGQDTPNGNNSHARLINRDGMRKTAPGFNVGYLQGPSANKNSIEEEVEEDIISPVKFRPSTQDRGNRKKMLKPVPIDDYGGGQTSKMKGKRAEPGFSDVVDADSNRGSQVRFTEPQELVIEDMHKGRKKPRQIFDKEIQDMSKDPKNKGKNFHSDVQSFLQFEEDSNDEIGEFDFNEEESEKVVTKKSLPIVKSGNTPTLQKQAIVQKTQSKGAGAKQLQPVSKQTVTPSTLKSCAGKTNLNSGGMALMDKLKMGNSVVKESPSKVSKTQATKKESISKAENLNKNKKDLYKDVRKLTTQKDRRRSVSGDSNKSRESSSDRLYNHETVSSKMKRMPGHGINSKGLKQPEPVKKKNFTKKVNPNIELFGAKIDNSQRGSDQDSSYDEQDALNAQDSEHQSNTQVESDKAKRQTELREQALQAERQRQAELLKEQALLAERQRQDQLLKEQALQAERQRQAELLKQKDLEYERIERDKIKELREPPNESMTTVHESLLRPLEPDELTLAVQCPEKEDDDRTIDMFRREVECEPQSIQAQHEVLIPKHDIALKTPEFEPMDQLPLVDLVEGEGVPEKESRDFSTQADQPVLEESKEQPSKNKVQITYDCSDDDDNFSEHEAPNNCRTFGIQTSDQHFGKVENTQEFQKQQQERAESIDWANSGLFADVSLEKGISKLKKKDTNHHDGGNQVEEKQIELALGLQTLSQIECEYNADQLKRKMSGKDNVEGEKLSELYQLGLNTVQTLMYELRLQREWETQTRQQYETEQADSEKVRHPDYTIKLLIRCKKMYEARTLIARLLKMIVQRDEMNSEIRAAAAEVVSSKQRNYSKSELDFMMKEAKRLSVRIASLINSLQEEHRIFKRPFILHGVEYLATIDTSTLK